VTSRNLPLGAVIAFEFKTWDIREEIALLKQIGIRRVQIYRNYVQDPSAPEIRRILDDAGLVADSLHGYFNLEKDNGPPFDLSAADPAARQQALDLMRGEANFARVLGCTDIIVHPVGLGPSADDPARPSALAESASHLAHLGRQTGVRFLIENMPPPMFGCRPDVLKTIVDTVNSPHVGLAYDAGHATLAGQPVETVHIMGPRLWGVHLHDTRGTDDDHLVPGSGIVPFEDVARALGAIGFAGTFMLEIYRTIEEVRRDLTAERLAFIEHLRRLASGQP
jgi:sugar phosphate isomerase/epimerase